MSKRRLARLATGLSIIAVNIYAGAAIAQRTEPPVAPSSATNTQLEDIVVTARRQTESLITVPIAVSAASATQLTRANATSFTDIAKLIPQLTISQAPSGNGATISIRGIGSSFTDPGLEQSVLVNIDNVQVGRGRIVAQSMFDLWPRSDHAELRSLNVFRKT